MKKIKEAWNSCKLYLKFNILILCAIILPMVILIAILLVIVRGNSISERTNSLEYEMDNSLHTIEQNVETCSLSTQMIINSQTLNEYLVSFRENREFTTEQMIDFYSTEVGGVERTVNSNSNLYQIRIYVDSDTMPEMIPLLFRQERLETLSFWNDDISSGSWHLDYDDRIFSGEAYDNRRHIASVVTKLENADIGEYATLEVAVSMKTLFPDMYDSEGDTWTCFIDSAGTAYYDEDNDGVKKAEDIRLILKDIDASTSGSRKMKLMGKSVIVCCEPVPSLGGTLIKVASLNSVDSFFARYVMCFMGIMLLCVVLLFLLFRLLVTRILKQFYDILGVVHEVQGENLDIRVKEPAKDEIGTLGAEFNEMLDCIQRLVKSSVNRELLMKNSEIRALQNQINAHFIYNVLESIKMMAEINEEYDISDAVTALGKLLRYSMHWTAQTVTVKEEVEYIRNYMTLINLRFDYEIYLSVNIPDELWHVQIPKMSLQPVIENAICHGLEELAEDTSIYLKGEITGNDCVIKITDSGKGMTDEQQDELRRKIDGELETSGGSGNGIGLKNVQDRIHIAFGMQYGLSIHSQEGCFTQVCMTIPYRKEHELGNE